MAFSLKKLGKQIFAQANPFDNGRTFNNQQPTNSRSIIGQAVHNNPVIGAARRQVFNPVGSGLQQAARIIPNVPSTSPMRFLNNAVINPIKTTDIHAGQALQGRNPYHGTVGQQAGQFGQDVINASSVLPFGKGAQIALKGAPVVSKIAQGAKFGAKVGGGYGAAQGVSTSLKDRLSLKDAAKTIGVNTAMGAGGGLALGAAGPLAGSAPRAIVPVSKAVKDVTMKTAEKVSPKLTQLDQSGKIQLPKIFGRSPENQDFHYSAPTNGYTKVSGKASDVRLKLNQVGAVGKNVPSEEELQYAHTFKVSPEQARAELGNLNKEQSMAASRQMKKPQGVGLPKGVKEQLQPTEQFKRGVADNTNLNPMKVEAPVVKPGDYGQARLRPGAVSRPIEFSAGQTINSMKKLGASEKAGFWDAVENPANIKSPVLKEAISRWNDLSNRVHATSQALGGNTNYISKYARHNWDLTDPKMAAKYDALLKERGGAAIDPHNFAGINSQNRAFSSIREGQAAGFKLKNPGNPEQDIIDYANSASGTLRKQALAKAIHEADINSPDRALSMNVSNHQQIEGLSPQAMKEIRAFERHEASSNKAVRGVRTANVAAKTTILSGGQFHPINISVLRAGPSTALAGHPIAAVKGVARTFRPLLLGGKGAVDRVMQKALQDGIVEKAAKIGAPYGQAGYNVEGTALKHGVGHKLVFERQMPMMHDQVVRSVIHDLEKKGVSLDSEEARQAGVAANATMGFINKEALNISPRVRQGMSDLMLAGQFTPSKVLTVSKIGKGGVAGKYARSDVVSNVAAATALITGVGYALGQNSDSIKDVLLRALINPAIPTPMKDKKGNNIEMRIPLTYTGEISKILGLKLKRGADGHLGVDWKPTDALTAHSGLMEWMRSRLAPVPSTAVKLATNTNFADKPLYDPNAQAGKKAIQAGTTIGQGLLPIGTQGIPNSEFVKNHVPGSAREILEANTPGSNPVLKGAASSIGFSPRTDQTVGKGLESSRYFNALSDAKKGLNDHEKAALELYAGNKKNEVTGKYDVKPNANDTPAKARALLDQPKVIDKLITMNKSLNKQGGKVDPLWTGSKDQVTKVLQYQAMPPGGNDRKHWYNQNKDWYQPLADRRTGFFSSLPKGDPNKPSAPVEYPKASPAVASKQDQFFKITDSAERSSFLRDNPEVQTQLDKQVEYNNKMREAQGYSALDTFPKAPAGLQKVIDTYNKVPKGGGKRGGNKFRAQWIQSHPKEFAAMTHFFTQASLYGLQEDAGQAQFKDTGFSSKGLGEIYNIGKNDIKQGKDKNGKNVYALTTGQSGGKTYTDENGNTFADLGQGSGYGSGGGFTPYQRKPKTAGSAYKYAVSLNAGGKARKPQISVSKGKKAVAYKSTKPKVSSKKSLV